MEKVKEDIRVSIVTVSYNSEKTIGRTIESVLGQTYKNIEYIIVDGASKDGTMDVVEGYRDDFGDRLKVISEPDDGIYYAMNKGIGLATGELIGIINSDDHYEPEAVAHMVEALHKERAAAEGGIGVDSKQSVEGAADPGEDMAEACDDLSASALSDEGVNDLKSNRQAVCDNDERYIFYGKTGFYRDGELLRVSMSDVDKLEEKMISHPSCFVTRGVYETIGVFDTKYTSVADYDFMLRCYRSGIVRFVPVHEHIANFALGGMSSTSKAYLDLLRLQANYGKISKMEAAVAAWKARLAIRFEKAGRKPIKLHRTDPYADGSDE